MRVSLNIDLGELPDEAAELYALATVANIACGGHAGDEASMARAVRLALAAGTAVAAHPSYPDRPRFGRVSMTIPPDDLARVIGDQCSALAAIAEVAGARIAIVKPHGALYHDTREPEVARAVLDGVAASLESAMLVGPPHGALRDLCAERGLSYAREGFADRAYRGGALVPRGEVGALLASPAACVAQALRLAESDSVETICVHGDTPNAVAIAAAVRAALESRGLLATPP